ncbi:MAG: alpha/beta hydrolase [Phycisphaerales bacterium]|nr:MAG: alpha/beta hydrolase [Phycisphaerales bacterium]
MKRFIELTLVGLAVVMSLAAVGLSDATETPAKVELLWPQGAPGAEGDQEGDKPSLTIYLPSKDKSTGAAVVICPGGGYGFLAMDHEGHQVARWLNSFGVAGFILKYRHRRSGAGYGHPAPLQDAQRAVRTVRGRAKEWGVDPGRIGILGFSAGGHLASSAGTHFHKRYGGAADPIDRVSCRPDFMILLYPVISLTEWFTHTGSRRNLLGKDPDRKLVKSLSNEKRVTPETPPTFLVHTYEDKGVPAENSLYFYLALRKAKVPAEMHIFQKGRHGFGLGSNSGPVSRWPDLCADWMRGLGLLDKKQQESE